MTNTIMLKTKQAVIDRLKTIQQNRQWNEKSIQNLQEQIELIQSSKISQEEERQKTLFEMSIDMYEQDNLEIDEETNRLLDELNLLKNGK